MNQKRKKAIAILLLVTMLFTILPTAAFAAEDIVTSGTCGDPNDNDGKNVTWELTQNNEDNTNPTYTLTISGKGAMMESTLPWDGFRSSITAVQIGADVTTIGTEAFEWCVNLETVSFGSNSKLTTIGSRAFQGCTSLQSIQLPVSTTIGSSAFNGCKGLTSVAFVDDAQSATVSTSTISEMAFIGCENLNTVTFGTSSQLTEIGAMAFQYCAMTDIEIPASVNTINNSAFYGCENLKTVTFGDNLQSTTSGALAIGEEAFFNCTNLTSVDFGDNSQLTTIGTKAFMHCEKLETVGFGSNSKLTTIGAMAFQYCAMTDIEIPASVNTINNSVFYGCENLKTVTFGDDSQLTTIGGSAFNDCNSLTNVVYGGSKSQWTRNVSLGENVKTYLNEDTMIYRKIDIIFDANGGIYNGETAFVVKKDTALGAQFPTTTPTRTGYTFDKWVDEGGNAVTADTTFGADTTITAQWRKNIGGDDVSHDITITCTPLTFTYDGTEKRPTVTVKDGNNTLAEGTDYTLSDVKKDVDTYTLTITGLGNYAGTVTEAWSITPKEISVTGATAEKRDYAAGNTDVEIDSVTFSDGTTLTKGTDYTATGTITDENAGADKTVSVTVTLNGTAAKNYTLTGNTTTTTVEIERISYDGTKTTTGSATYGATGEVDLSALIADGGTLTVGTVADSNSVLNTENGMPKLDGNKLQFAFNDNSTLVNKTVDVPVTVSDCTNYSDYIITVTLTVSVKPNESSGNYYGGGYYVPEEETDKTNKTEETTWNNPFTDVSETDWYYHAVQYAHQHKLFAGMSTTEFAPNMPMSRGMLVTVLYRMAGSPAVDGDMPFGDVNADAYYKNAILWAVQNNIVSGIADNLFAPDTDITREQLAVILYRFAQYCGYDTTQGGMQMREYSDYENISGYALNAMTWAVNSGLLKGKGENNIAPQDTATRAEVAAILQRFIENN